MALKRAWPALFYCFVVTAAAAAINITLTVPEGTTNHGSQNLLCTPTSWTDIAIFFLGNYMAHAATVPTFLGDHMWVTYSSRVLALLLPGFGLYKGIEMLLTFANFGKSELEVAVRAQALYMVIRTEIWRPHAGDTISHSLVHLQSRGPENEPEAAKLIQFYVYETPWRPQIDGFKNISWKTLHGQREDLPPGYLFAPVPREAIIDPLPPEDQTCIIASENNFLKSLIAVGQTLYGISTLYRAKGDQITRYGYAAFGLTVIPYVYMSLVNLAAGLMCPHYTQAYLIDSSILSEARQRGGTFHGIVGKLREADLKISASSDSGLIAVDGPLVISAVSSIGEDLEGLKVDLDIIKNHSSEGEVKEKVVIAQTVIFETQLNKASEITQASDRILEHCSLQVQEEVSNYITNIDVNDVHNPVLLIPQYNPFATVSKDTMEYNMESAVWNKLNRKWNVTFPGSEYFIFKNNSVLATFLAILAAPIPFAIIAWLSKFEPGGSSYAQRVWITAWICAGQGYMLCLYLLFTFMYPLAPYLPERLMVSIVSPITVSLLCVPAIGSFIVVGEMLKEYGTCIDFA